MQKFSIKKKKNTHTHRPSTVALAAHARRGLLHYRHAHAREYKTDGSRTIVNINIDALGPPILLLYLYDFSVYVK